MKILRVVFLTAICLSVTAAIAGDPSSVDVTFIVVRDYNGKPVRNASVVLHKVDKKGHQEKGGQQIKTNEDGHASYPALPIGKVRVQVIAPYLQTFGEDFDITKDTKEITIKLKRPQDQYTIYK